jgi:hypothetical protein
MGEESSIFKATKAFSGLMLPKTDGNNQRPQQPWIIQGNPVSIKTKCDRTLDTHSNRRKVTGQGDIEALEYSSQQRVGLVL